jgi:hypothetical protein
MANAKDIYLPFQLTGLSGVYMRVMQDSTGYYLDHADGAFRATPATPNIPLTEVTSLPSVYSRSESRTVWTDGEYNIFGYDVTNVLICGATMFIMDDVEVTMDDVGWIKKVEGGNWELVGNKWIYYDTDGTTVLRQFNVKDASGNPSMTSIYKREKI